MDEYAALFGYHKKTPKPVFRDYAAEWDFIKQMDQLGDMHFPAAIQIEGDNAKMIGLSMIFIGEAANGNTPDCVR